MNQNCGGIVILHDWKNKPYKYYYSMYTKERYSSPDCEIINLKIEGVICASGVETGFDPTFGDPFNEEQNW